MPPKAAVWEWKNDKGSYEGYPDDFRAKVEKAYVEANGEGSKLVNHWDTDYTFNFDKMTQVNKDSGKSRDIQRTGPALPTAGAPKKRGSAAAAKVKVEEEDEEEENVEWEWKDGHKWAKYTPAMSKTMEEGYQGTKATITTSFGGNNYDINFDAKSQTNSSTKKVRKIRRLVNGKEHMKKKFKTEDEDEDADTLSSKKVKKEESSSSSAAAPPPPLATSAGGAAVADMGKTKVSGGGSPFHPSSAGAIAGAPAKLIKKGRGVVDPASGMAEKCHIYESGDKVYQVMLNQTNIGQNNNKFYVIQLLETDGGGSFYVFTRWGRVGVPGQTNLDKMGSLPGAISQFCKKFRDKTQNDFNSLPTFHKVTGKYQLMDIDLGDDKKPAAAGLEEASKGDVPASKLPTEVQSLLKMIGNKSEMVKSMKELEIDTNKMPLGKISKKQIKEAFGFLSDIDNELKKAHPGNSKIVEASSMFYTLIPHDFGMATPPAIRSTEVLKRKMELLEILSDLEIASKILEETKAGANPLDSSYKNMNCDLTPISHSSADFKRVEEYVRNTHGKTHSAYKLSVTEVFEVNRGGEDAKYKAVGAKIPNKKMLWHGSRTTNFMGILSQGLRIAPPEAPVTGYMFGKGVYYADSSSKSANYCHSSTSNPEGLLLLCEVAMGTTTNLTAAKYMDKPIGGTDSTTGLGKMRPDPAGSETVDGVEWPIGKIGDSGTTATSLLYPEYIVYNTSQQKMRYLIRVKFHYGKKY